VAFNNYMRRRLENNLLAVTGLTLWLTGELELSETELDDLFCRLGSFLGIVSSIAWPSDDDSHNEDAASLEASTGPKEPGSLE